MPKYGVNPFTGEVTPIYSAAAGDGGGGDGGGDRYLIVQHPDSAQIWLIDSPSAYATPTIYVSSIGDRTFEQAVKVDAKWQYLNPYKLEIRFSPYPCSGYTILRFN